MYNFLKAFSLFIVLLNVSGVARAMSFVNLTQEQITELEGQEKTSLYPGDPEYFNGTIISIQTKSLDQVFAEDPLFEQEIRRVLRKPRDTITMTDIASITEFRTVEDILIQSLQVLSDYARFYVGSPETANYAEGMIFAHALHFGSVFQNADNVEVFIHGIYVSNVFVPGFFTETDDANNAYFVPGMVIGSRIIPGMAIDTRFGWETKEDTFIPGAFTGAAVEHTPVGDVNFEFTPGVFDIAGELVDEGGGYFQIPSLDGGMPLYEFGSFIPDSLNAGSWLGVAGGIGGLLGAGTGLIYGLCIGLGGAALFGMIGTFASIGVAIGAGVAAVGALVGWVISLFSDDDDDDDTNDVMQVEDSLNSDSDQPEEDNNNGFVETPGCGTIINCMDILVDEFPGADFDLVLNTNFEPLTAEMFDVR